MSSEAVQSEDPFGYLLVHFIEDPQGHAEKIYLDVSRGDNPEQWVPLNGGKPVLESVKGTTGVRDPYITRNPETGRIYILATDLRVFGGDRGQGDSTEWHYWTHSGSTNLVIWETDDLIHWEGPRMLDMGVRPDGSTLELGMAWAPECLWVSDYYGPQQGAFVVYWSSKLFADSDTAHADETVYDRILWGATTDFTQQTYEYGGVFVDTGGNTIDTTMVQRSLPDGSKRTYRITKDNSFGRGIFMESTDAQKWWLPAAEWTTVQTRIGADYVSDGNPGGVEGPAVFASNHEGTWYLFVDVIPSVGYRPMISHDLDSGWEYLTSHDFELTPHTKHGGVLQLKRGEYERIVRGNGLSALQASNSAK